MSNRCLGGPRGCTPTNHFSCWIHRLPPTLCLRVCWSWKWAGVLFSVSQSFTNHSLAPLVLNPGPPVPKHSIFSISTHALLTIYHVCFRCPSGLDRMNKPDLANQEWVVAHTQHTFYSTAICHITLIWKFSGLALALAYYVTFSISVKYKYYISSMIWHNTCGGIQVIQVGALRFTDIFL